MEETSHHPIGEYIGHIDLKDLPLEVRKRAEESHRRFEEIYLIKDDDKKDE